MEKTIKNKNIDNNKTSLELMLHERHLPGTHIYDHIYSATRLFKVDITPALFVRQIVSYYLNNLSMVT